MTADFGLSDTDSDSVLVQCPDIDIVKTADPDGPVNAGDEIGFMITISNDGPGKAYDVEASDTLPGDFDWAIESQSGGWTLLNGVLCFGPADMLKDTSSTVTVTATSSATRPAASSRTTRGSMPATTTARTTTLTSRSTARTSRSTRRPMRASSAPATRRCSTIVVTNLGPGTAYDVSLEDQLPGDITWTDDNADCTIDGAGLLTCDFDTLAEDAIRTVTVTGQTQATDCGVLENEVDVEASNEDPDEARQQLGRRPDHRRLPGHRDHQDGRSGRSGQRR